MVEEVGTIAVATLLEGESSLALESGVEPPHSPRTGPYRQSFTSITTAIVSPTTITNRRTATLPIFFAMPAAP